MLTNYIVHNLSLGIAPTILTKRLTVLTEEGLLEKRVYSSRPTAQASERCCYAAARHSHAFKTWMAVI